MTLQQIIEQVTDKNNLNNINDYTDFCLRYLEFIKSNLQAVIVSRNENQYRFFQYREDGSYNVTRPINSELMLSFEEIESGRANFLEIVDNVRNSYAYSPENRRLLDNFIYTCQQSIGAALDALPANRSNTARKINGDLFERYIRLVIARTGVCVSDGTICIPVEVPGEEQFTMRYQQDLIISIDDVTKAIGSVKTSSKDRLDKIFIDKFLYNRLTETDTPHFAIFLNDVQRKGREGKYGISATFLPGHFKGYTIRLNPMDGVYYFDIRPNMLNDDILRNHIHTFDKFLMEDMWRFTE